MERAVFLRLDLRVSEQQREKNTHTRHALQQALEWHRQALHLTMGRLLEMEVAGFFNFIEQILELYPHATSIHTLRAHQRHAGWRLQAPAKTRRLRQATARKVYLPYLARETNILTHVALLPHLGLALQAPHLARVRRRATVQEAYLLLATHLAQARLETSTHIQIVVRLLPA